MEDRIGRITQPALVISGLHVSFIGGVILFDDTGGRFELTEELLGRTLFFDPRLSGSGWISSSVVNAGDGTHEHPTQALLDAATVRDVATFAQPKALSEGIECVLVNGEIAYRGFDEASNFENCRQVTTP